MCQKLSFELGRKYSYEYLCQFFGGEENFDGIETPEVSFEVGNRVVNLLFESDRIENGYNEFIVLEPRNYTLKEVSSWPRS